MAKRSYQFLNTEAVRHVGKIHDAYSGTIEEEVAEIRIRMQQLVG